MPAPSCVSAKGWLNNAAAAAPSADPDPFAPATGVTVPRSALSRLMRLPVMNVKLPLGSWSIPVIAGISAWSRSSSSGSRLSVTVPGGVTVSVAALLGVVL